ncbi:MAG: DUF4157 domain-containing protein, partial [Chloroflexi bacterium]|nr:DUF4157 domain-containing protein [Chloroflexota bacterium]
MPEHFVVAMMDVGHLRWGACEFSAAASGDVHHFDLRDPHHTPAPTPAPATAAAASEEAEPVARKKIGTSSDASQLKSNENRANDTGLPDDLKANIESLSGHSLDDVKVNFESAKPAQLQAHAYAQGSDIHLAPGQEQHLPHEAWHVVQQKEGRVKATSEIDGRSVNDDTALEKEANVMGAKAASHFAHDFSQVSTHTRAEVTEDEQGTRPQQVAQRAFDQAVWAGQYTTPALTSVVQRLHQPIVGRAPASAISIQRFITLVEAEEARYPESEQRNTRLMITRLRKIFYDRQGWDEHLIQGARGVAAPYSTNRRETGRERVEVPGPFNDFEVVRHRHTVRGAGGRTPEIARNQEIALSDGTYIDLGHVFAGLDAANYPQAVSTGIPLVTIGIDSNVDAVTWVGDLGSVVAEIQFQFVNQNFSISESEIQAVINEYASPQDMMGNIDAYVIAGQYNISQTSGGMKVSEMLRQYYL